MDVPQGRDELLGVCRACDGLARNIGGGCACTCAPPPPASAGLPRCRVAARHQGPGQALHEMLTSYIAGARGAVARSWEQRKTFGLAMDDSKDRSLERTHTAIVLSVQALVSGMWPILVRATC